MRLQLHIYVHDGHMIGWFLLFLFSFYTFKNIFYLDIFLFLSNFFKAFCF